MLWLWDIFKNLSIIWVMSVLALTRLQKIELQILTLKNSYICSSVPQWCLYGFFLYIIYVFKNLTSHSVT